MVLLEAESVPLDPWEPPPQLPSWLAAVLPSSQDNLLSGVGSSCLCLQTLHPRACSALLERQLGHQPSLYWALEEENGKRHEQLSCAWWQWKVGAERDNGEQYNERWVRNLAPFEDWKGSARELVIDWSELGNGARRCSAAQHTKKGSSAGGAEHAQAR